MLQTKSSIQHRPTGCGAGANCAMFEAGRCAFNDWHVDQGHGQDEEYGQASLPAHARGSGLLMMILDKARVKRHNAPLSASVPGLCTMEWHWQPRIKSFFFQVQNHQDWVIFGLVFALQACFKSISRPTRLIKRPMALKVLLYNATPALAIEAMKGLWKAFFINCKQILDKCGLKLMIRNKLRGMRRLM